MNILAIDTSQQNLSVAVRCNQQEIILLDTQEYPHPAENISTRINHALQQAGIGYKDINNIITSIGPGSFTSIRICIATALGIHTAINNNKVAIAGVSTLAVMSYIVSKQNTKNKVILSALEAGGNEVYYQYFNPDLTPLSEPAIAPSGQIPKPDSIEQSIIAGGTGITLENIQKIHNCQIITENKNKATAGDFIEYFQSHATLQTNSPPTPLYVRPLNVKKPPNKNGLLKRSNAL